MPRKRESRMPAIQARVTLAFFASGYLNAGMPSEIASTPVSAVQPEAKALRRRKRPSDCVGAASDSGAVTSAPAKRDLVRPTPIIRVTLGVKRYGGSGKILPD